MFEEEKKKKKRKGLKGLVREFYDFVQEYKVVGLAIAFVMGAAVKELVQTMVDNLIMPLVTFFIPGGAWKTATIALGKVVIGWGAFLAEMIDFVIIAVVVFLMAKAILGEEKVEKK